MRSDRADVLGPADANALNSKLNLLPIGIKLVSAVFKGEVQDDYIIFLSNLIGIAFIMYGAFLYNIKIGFTDFVQPFFQYYIVRIQKC